RDEVRFARDLPDVRRLAEQLVRRLQVGVHEADELLDLAVRRFLPLPAVAAAERLRRLGGAAFGGPPENLAHVCVDAQDQRYGVERDAHGPSSVPWRCAGRHASGAARSAWAAVAGAAARGMRLCRRQGWGPQGLRVNGGAGCREEQRSLC